MVDTARGRSSNEHVRLLFVAQLYSRVAVTTEHQFGLLDPSVLPLIAARALADGADSPQLRLLAGLPRNGDQHDIMEALSSVKDAHFPEFPATEATVRKTLLVYWLQCLPKAIGNLGGLLDLALIEALDLDDYPESIPRQVQALFLLQDAIASGTASAADIEDVSTRAVRYVIKSNGVASIERSLPSALLPPRCSNGFPSSCGIPSTQADS